MYQEILSPILDQFDSEKGHALAKNTLHLLEQNQALLKLSGFVMRAGARVSDPRLNITVGGVALENPVIVGAGWDKQAIAVKALSELGFGAVEIGTVTRDAQPGNPKPRQFVIGKGVAINCLGFNGPGMEVVAANLKRYQGSGIAIGVNLGINKTVTPEEAPERHAVVAKRLYPYATYFTINVASPNTPGLRNLLTREFLLQIIQAVKAAINESGAPKPVFVKTSPDLTPEALDELIDVALAEEVQGLIASNTTIRADLKARYGARWEAQAGGLSGSDPEYRKMATEQVRQIYTRAQGKLAVIGVGGVNDAESAIEKLFAGASAVQVVTGLRGRGPSVANEINRGLVSWMEKNGVKSLSEIVGTGETLG